MGDIREPNVAVWSPSSSLNPDQSWIGAERWSRAEDVARKIICQVQPTAVSEESRKKVIDYVRRLILGCLGCQVFPYGSVPLKTYLPDGDIDLTAFGGASVEDSLANDMVSLLEGKDPNRAAEFVVKDVQIIHAEVKLVKCIVQNIVVDISFNQIGGLSTLCFLEQVDRLIGKDHLFKRSIILIKTWCYYESRILGAHHGLISTYALEILVLYIFHVFHSTLSGPLAVLYKFLDYFSKFDWDNYCVSLTGPVCISLFPEIMVEAPENGGGDLLLSDDFLRYCADVFSVPSKGVDINSRTFPPKHLNIVDPLKENNNLGRSISKGNFYRIRSAFTYGAQQLGRILMQPENKIADELCNFFSNTLERHGSGQRPDVREPDSKFGPAFSVLETDSFLEEKVVSEHKFPNCISTAGDCINNKDGSPQHEFNNITASGKKMEFCRTTDEQQRGYMKVFCYTMSEADGSAKGSALLGNRFSGDAEDLANSKIHGLKISNDSCKISPPSGIAHYAPHLYFSNSILGNGMMKYENSDTKQPENYENKLSSGVLQAPEQQNKNLLVGNDEGLKDPHPVNCDWTSENSVESLESLNSLSDLGGDYDSHFNCLQYGRWCYEYASSGPPFPMPPPLPLRHTHFQSMNSWDAIHHSSQFRRNGFSHRSVNGVIPSPVFYPMNSLLIPGVNCSLEKMPKPRGTGTYFPNMHWHPQGYRPSTVKGRYQAPARWSRNNGRPTTFTEFHADHVGMTGSSDTHQSSSPRRKVNPNVNGISLQSEGVAEFGSVTHIPLGAPLLECSMQPIPDFSLPQTSNQGLPTLEMQRPKPILVMNQDRFTMNSSYHLKDEEDFPPLSV